MPRKEKPLAELKQKLENFAEFEKENLIKRPEWGAINLEEARPDFDRIYDIINYLNILPLDILTVNAINSIKGAVEQVNDYFEQINQFSIESADPAGQRNNFITQIQNQADSLYTQASPWIPFLAYQKGDVSQNIETLNKSVQEANTLIEKAKTSISEKEKEIQDIITKAREASAAAGAAIFTKDFKNESIELQEKAKEWLRITGILAMGTLIIALAMWYLTEPGLDKGQLWQKLGTKIAILGILFSGTFWCGKIYKALMHQATINKHRAMSIQTLQAFSAAVEDVSAKDAVVVEATRAVFGNVPSGYIDNPQSSDGDVKIFEIAKSLIPKGGG